MAGNTSIELQIIADTADAQDGLRTVSRDLERTGASARTASERMDSFGGTSGDAATGLGALSGAMDAMGFSGLASGMQLAATGLDAMEGATVLTSVAQKLAAGTTKAFSAAMNLLKTAILTNPIFWIAAILIGIVVAFVLLYKKCDGFRKVVDAVFKFAWNLIKGFWNFIKAVFAALLNVLKKPFEFWKGVVKAVVNAITGYFRWAVDTIKGILGRIADICSGITNKVKEIFSKVVDFITKPFKQAMDWVKNHLKLPKINLPFGIGKSSAPAVYASATPTAMARTSAGLTYVLNINAPSDPHATVRLFRRLVREDQARLGRTSQRPVLA